MKIPPELRDAIIEAKETASYASSGDWEQDFVDRLRALGFGVITVRRTVREPFKFDND